MEAEVIGVGIAVGSVVVSLPTFVVRELAFFGRKFQYATVPEPSGVHIVFTRLSWVMAMVFGASIYGWVYARPRPLMVDQHRSAATDRDAFAVLALVFVFVAVMLMLVLADNWWQGRPTADGAERPRLVDRDFDRLRVAWLGIVLLTLIVIPIGVGLQPITNRLTMATVEDLAIPNLAGTTNST